VLKNIFQLFVIAILACLSLTAQAQPVAESRVYNWDELEPVKDQMRIRRQVISGSTGTLATLTVHISTLEPGLMPHAAHTHPDEEELIIVREGSLKATIRDKSRVLGPGSVAYVIPGEEHGFENTGDKATTYYILKFKTKTPMDMERATKAGGSFMIDWNEVGVTRTEKGARRNIIDKPTAMFKRFEMHVTTLNQGLSSHAPHTHPAEEMIIIRSGETSMQIDKSHQTAHPAGVVFLSSMIPHALTNKGEGPCEYYAFQWE
jgi:(S)-ureidoglycine aminohydrolase